MRESGSRPAPAVPALLFFCGLSTAAGCTGVVGSAGGNPGIPNPGGGITTPTVAALCKGTLTHSPTRLVRLNDVQVTNAIKALIPGVMVPPIHTPGRPEHEFVSWADQFPVQDAFAAQLSDAAFNVAAQVAKAPAMVVSCAAGQAELACAEAFIDRFVSRAFRRALAPDERAEMLAVYNTGVANGAGFASGIELVVAATLSAPSFLYRTELGLTAAPAAAGKIVPLTPREVASWLSMTLHNSLPDDELWQAAVDGSLAQPAILERQVDRLLALPQTREVLTGVALSWADVPAVLTTEKTERDLAGKVFDAPVRASLFDETRRFVADLIWNGGTFADLFTSRRAFLDSGAAAFYGVAAAGGVNTAVMLPADRAGLLARAGFIGATRYGDNPEVFRGRLLRERLLCGKLADPPPGVNTDQFNAQYAGLSTRQRIAVRAGQPSCKACHVFMDTLGIAFDQFGALGQPVTSVNGVPPDPAGELTGTDVDGPFADLGALSSRLAGSQHALGCAVEQMMTYAVGRELSLETPGSADACARAAITAAVEGDHGKLSQLFRALALNPMFTTRVVGGQQ